MSLMAGNNTPFRLFANTAGVQARLGAGQLHSVNICVKGATSNLLTIYDGTSTAGTVIANIDTTANVASLFLDVAFNVGLFVVLAAGTPADVTLAFQ